MTADDRPTTDAVGASDPGPATEVDDALAALGAPAGASGRSGLGDTLRAGPPGEHADAWGERDEEGAARDRAAAERDRAADRRDAEAEAAEADALAAHPDDAELTALFARVTALREAGAADRRQAAADRARAAEDRRRSRLTVRRAHIDSLTGVYTREQGFAQLQHEIDRCRRTGAPFVLAFVDIDGLKTINDTLGHAMGDALIRKVCAVLKEKLRSYDPIVRIGGDEFLCGLSGTAPPAAAARIQSIRTAVEEGHPPGTITVGYADLGPDDTLETLIDRADHDMYAHRQTK